MLLVPAVLTLVAVTVLQLLLTLSPRSMWLSKFDEANATAALPPLTYQRRALL